MRSVVQNRTTDAAVAPFSSSASPVVRLLVFGEDEGEDEGEDAGELVAAGVAGADSVVVD